MNLQKNLYTYVYTNHKICYCHEIQALMVTRLQCNYLKKTTWICNVF